MLIDLVEGFISAKHAVEECEEAVGISIAKLARTADAETLNRTALTQPLLVAHAIAVVAVLRAETNLVGASPDGSLRCLTAGHSVGEIGALHAASALSTTAAMRLARIRGLAMQWSQDRSDRAGAMKALLVCDPVAVHKLAAASNGMVQLASINSQDQCVISGDAGEVARLADEAKEAKHSRRAVTLPTSVAFHSSMMSSAAAVLNHVLRTGAESDSVQVSPDVDEFMQLNAFPLQWAPVTLEMPSTADVVACCDAEVYAFTEAPAALQHLRSAFISQTTSTVLWLNMMDLFRRECAGAESQDESIFLEMGPGSTLTSLVTKHFKRTVKGATVLPCGTAAQLTEALNLLRN